MKDPVHMHIYKYISVGRAPCNHAYLKSNITAHQQLPKTKSLLSQVPRFIPQPYIVIII